MSELTLPEEALGIAAIDQQGNLLKELTAWNGGLRHQSALEFVALIYLER